MPVPYLGCVFRLKFLSVSLTEFCDGIFKQNETVSLSFCQEQRPTLEINRRSVAYINYSPLTEPQVS